MSDLTIGEVGKQLVVSLYTYDYTQTPPAKVALNLVGATVTLAWVIVDNSNPPIAPTRTVQMIITDAVNGVVSYTFQSGDLVKPASSSMGKNGVFRFFIEAVFPGGSKTLFTNTDGLLTIKDDSVL